MDCTEGEWKAYLTNKLPAEWTICAGTYGDIGICKIVPDNSVSTSQKKANAILLAASPLMYGQLKTDNDCLTMVQDIIVEIAKTCSPSHADMLVAAQAQLCGVVAGNELALAKAEGGE